MVNNAPGNSNKHHIAESELAKYNSKNVARLEEIESLKKRNPILHWAAFVLSVISLVSICIWVFGTRGAVPPAWIYFDIGLGVFSTIEFFTRSGFRWNRFGYLRTRFFDVIAIVPALAMVNHGLFMQEAGVWIVLVARAIRVIDRLLGDGFVGRNLLAIVEGFEEEITDRVLQRIITRIQLDMDRAGFSHGIARALEKNKPTVLNRIREAHPREGLGPELARIVGLDSALERAEERTYDALVSIIDSEEIDTAVRDAVNSVFTNINRELNDKSWRRHIGIRRRKTK